VGLVLAVSGSFVGFAALLAGGIIFILMSAGRLKLPPRKLMREIQPPVPAGVDAPVNAGTLHKMPQTIVAGAIVPAQAAPSITDALPQSAPEARRHASWLFPVSAFLIGLIGGVIVDRVVLWPASLTPSDAGGQRPPGPDLGSIAALLNPDTTEFVRATIQIGGESVDVSYSPLDIGQIADIFDGRFDTLMRGRGANPYVFEVRYSQPRTANAVVLSLVSMDNYKIEVTAAEANSRSISIVKEGTELARDPTMRFTIPDGPRSIQSVRVEILDRRPPPQEGFHTHIREFALE
jgi:hypothetical protein